MNNTMNKLRILADSAKYDVSCSSSGVGRKNTGKIGNSHAAGICHTWSADGRCISLLKILFTNKCVYDCEYCMNRRTSDIERESFEPEELAKLTIEFYKRNYIEGLFLSSAVEVSPDYTAERILSCLKLLRNKYGFAGYIHAKIIPGISPELLHEIGLVADRLSVNIEFPTEEGLRILAPQKKLQEIIKPMKQITTTMLDQKSLKGPGTMFKGKDVNQDLVNRIGDYSGINYLQPGGFGSDIVAEAGQRRKFAPAGQTTQMIIGASGETDRQIVATSEKLYRTFIMKRVYFSAYIPIVSSSLLPSTFTAPPLVREHRLYQADWLLRFYGFSADEILDDSNPNLELEMDPKAAWALRNIQKFPMEINKVSLEELMRIPGIGEISARRIVRQRRVASISYEDLKKMGVSLKRARFFLTCQGKYYGGKDLVEETIKGQILLQENIRNKMALSGDGNQLSMFQNGGQLKLESGGGVWQSTSTTPALKAF